MKMAVSLPKYVHINRIEVPVCDFKRHAYIIKAGYVTNTITKPLVLEYLSI